MVLQPDPRRVDRRAQFKLLRGSSWRKSWCNSTRTLDSHDGLKDGSFVPSVQKTVQFASNHSSLVTEIPQSENAKTSEEIPAMWYQSEDYMKFEKECSLTSYAYMNSKRGRGPTLDAEKYTVRGLESQADGRLGTASASEKKALSQALKEEEERQKAENVFPDLDKMRKVSLQHTKGSRDRALALAHLDAKEVRESNNNDFQMPLLRLRR